MKLEVDQIMWYRNAHTGARQQVVVRHICPDTTGPLVGVVLVSAQGDIRPCLWWCTWPVDLSPPA